MQLAPRRWGTARTELGSSHSSWKGSLLLSTPAAAACLASKQTAYLSLPRKHGSERYAACFDEVVARAVRVSQPAVLSALLVIQLFGIVISPPYFPQRAPKGALRPFLGRSAPSLLFHDALRNILLPAGFPVTIHMIALEQTFVNGSLQKIFSRRFHS